MITFEPLLSMSARTLLTEPQVGRLNLLTPQRVAAAAKEIQTGEIVPVKCGQHILVFCLANISYS